MFSSWQLPWRKIFTLPVARRRPFRKPTARWVLGALEDRDVPSTFTVTNTHDSGANSLRQAIVDSNTQPGVNGPNLINFNLAECTFS